MIPRITLFCFVAVVNSARVERGLRTPSAATPSSCPVATFDERSDRFLVSPVTTPTRAHFELRKLADSGDPCSGELFIDRTIQFQAVHHHAHSLDAKDHHWHGVLEMPPEVGAEDPTDGKPIFALCYPGGGLQGNTTSSSCVGLLSVPPPAAILGKIGIWVPRSLAPKINSYVWAIVIVLISWVVAVVAILIAVPALVHSCFGSQEQSTEVDRHAPGNVPRTGEIIFEVGMELMRMTVGVLTLLLVTFFFVVRREMTQLNMFILTGFPILLVIIHMSIVLSGMSRALLYYAALDCKVHICFTPRKPMYCSLTWILLFLAVIAYLFAVVYTLFSDVQLSGGCPPGKPCEPVSMTTMCVKIWALLFPAIYCILLIYNDEQFELRLVPLYNIVAEGKKGKESDPEKAQRFLGSLKPEKEADFLKAGDQIYKNGGIEEISVAAVAEACARLDIEDETPRSIAETVSSAISSAFSPGRWYWTWKVRLARSKNRVRGLWHLAVVIVSAIGFMTTFILAAMMYSNTLFPTLNNVTPMVGQLTPPFDPHVFDYMIFVDQKVKGSAFEILTNKDLVATSEMRLPNFASKSLEAWTNTTHTAYVPFLSPPTSHVSVDRDGDGVIAEGEGQSSMYKNSKREPVTVEFLANGAGKSMTYRFTIIKLAPRVTALEYKYNTSSRVDEVTVLKEINFEKMAPAEGAESEGGEMADAEGEGVAIYVPEDTTSVFIDLHREIQIFGPAGAVVRGKDLNWFDASSNVNLGSKKPSSNETESDNGGEKTSDESGESRTSGHVALDEDLTSVPVELKPNGTDPFNFQVSIVRVSNRLVNLDFEVARDGVDASGWHSAPPLPAFRPFVNEYEAFFEVPHAEKSGKKSSPFTALQLPSSEQSNEKATAFFRIKPQGDARVNWVKAEIVPDEPGQDLEPFCRPAGDEYQPLDPNAAEATTDLSCGISANEAEKAEKGKPTDDLTIQANGRNFTGHFFVKYSFVPGYSLPFSLRLHVMFHDENPALVGNNTNISEHSSHVYTIKFLPQKRMGMDFNLPIKGPPASFYVPRAQKLAQAPAPPFPMLLDATDAQPEEAPMIKLPVFLNEAYRSDVFEYFATVPQGVMGTIDMTMGQFHSFWAGIKGDHDSPLEGPDWSSTAESEAEVHRGGCSTGGGPATAAASAASTKKDEDPKHPHRGIKEQPLGEGPIEKIFSFGAKKPTIEEEIMKEEARAEQTKEIAEEVKEEEAKLAEKMKEDEKRAEKTKEEKTPKEEEKHPASPGKPQHLPAKPAAVPSAAPSAAPSPAPIPALAGEPCPIEVVAYERKDGFPHKYVVKLREALDDEALFIGSLLPDGTARAVSGFRPITHDFVANTFGLVYNWFQESPAPAPGPAPASSVSDVSFAAVSQEPVEQEKPTEPAPAPAPASAAATLVPEASLAVLPASASGDLEALWNGEILPIFSSGMEAWRSIVIKDKFLAEMCWCERNQPGSTCQEELRNGAPQLLNLSQPNKCTFELKKENRTLYKIEVGAGSQTRSALQDMAQVAEEAEEEAEEVLGSPSPPAPQPVQAPPPSPPSSPPEATTKTEASPPSPSVLLLSRSKIENYVAPPWDLFAQITEPVSSHNNQAQADLLRQVRKMPRKQVFSLAKGDKPSLSGSV